MRLNAIFLNAFFLMALLFSCTEQSLKENTNNIILANGQSIQNVCSVSIKNSTIEVYSTIDINNIAYCDELILLDKVRIILQLFLNVDTSLVSRNNYSVVIHQVGSCSDPMDLDFVSNSNNEYIRYVLGNIKDKPQTIKKLQYVVSRVKCYEISQLNYMIDMLSTESVFSQEDSLFSYIFLNYCSNKREGCADYTKLRELCSNIQQDTSLATYDSLVMHFNRLENIR